MKHKVNGFQKVFDSRNRRVRGLWVRNGTYYAQMRTLPGQPATKVPLHRAQTVPRAITEMQALKQKRQEGDLRLEKKRGAPGFAEMADTYLAGLAALDRKHQDTRRRESSSLDALKLYFGKKSVNQITMADATQYALWRKDRPRRSGWEKVSGRAIDLDIIALRHVMDKALELQQVRTNPITKWKKLAEDPKEVRLLTTEEVNSLIETSEKEIVCGKQFADYLRVLAASGGREQETLRLCWSLNVDWVNSRLGFGQDGRSKFGKSRWVQFKPARHSGAPD